ncbi:MAG: glycosyltransferase [Bdellovibrionaceae bacterium]|nr:glycosyltransferase [Pseudobdellovibrionaceae bacterium]
MFDQIRSLAQWHDVELVTWKESADRISRKTQLSDPFQGKVKVVSWGEDETSREGIGKRTLRTLNSLFSAAPSPADFYYPRSLDHRQELSEVDLAIYHYTYAWNWLSSRDNVREKTRVLHFHNIESDLYRLRAENEKIGPFRVIHRMNARKLTDIERILPNLVDECWYVSAKDASDFQTRLGHPAACQRVRPPSYDPARLLQRQRRFVEDLDQSRRMGSVLGFVGTLDFAPNILSLEWILDRLGPELLRRGWSGTLRVVGRNPSPEMREKLKQYPFVEYLGFLTDMEDFWSSLSAFLIPHIEGSGVRVKLLDAVASGIPTLANSAAVERVDKALIGSSLLWVSDDPQDWVRRILSIDGHQERKLLAMKPLEQVLDGNFIYGDFRE